MSKAPPSFAVVKGIAAALHHRWNKDFLEAGNKQLVGDTVREATNDLVKDM